MNGHPDRPPARMPVALMDILASHQMRAAVLGGLYQREKTGVGWYAEVSLLGSGLTALANQGTNALINGKTPRRQGSSHPNIAPYGDLLQCADGQLVLAVGSDAQFEGLCRTLGMEGLLSEKAFHTNAARVIHRARLMDALNEASKDWAWKDLHHALHGSRVPSGAVLDVMEALRQPGVEASYVVEEEGLRRLKTSAIHVGFSTAPTQLSFPSERLGVCPSHGSGLQFSKRRPLGKGTSEVVDVADTLTLRQSVAHTCLVVPNGIHTAQEIP